MYQSLTLLCVFSIQGRNSTRIYLFADLQYVYLIALRLIHVGGGA